MERERTPIRITVIDDNTPDVMLIEEALTSRSIPYELRHLTDGAEAVKVLCNQETGDPHPELIILDLNMPRVGGLEVLADLRNRNACLGVPVIVLTSSMAPEEEELARRLGADRYVRKPVDLYEFVDEVGKIIGEVLADRIQTQL